MPLPAQKFREMVLQLLYCRDMTGGDEEPDVIPFLMQVLCVTRQAVRAARVRVQCIWQKREQLDQQIAEASIAYALERIQRLERNILRLGIFELLHDDEIPAKVALDEALRLTRKFGTEAAVAFVNALLDRIYKQSQGNIPASAEAGC